MKISNKTLKNIAILIGFITVVCIIYETLNNYDKLMPIYKKANEEFLKKNYKKSLELYSKVYNSDNKNIYALEGQARSLMRLKLYNEAEKKFLEVIILDEEFATGYANLGILYDTIGKYKKAIHYYNIAILKDDKSVEGMQWFSRFLKNIQFKPASIRQRRDYLIKQFMISPDKRKFRKEDIDKLQPDFER